MKKSVCLTSSTSYQETVTQIKHAVMNLLHEALGSFGAHHYRVACRGQGNIVLARGPRSGRLWSSQPFECPCHRMTMDDMIELQT